MLNSLPNEHRCDFCGKGPFISNTSTCQKKSQHKFWEYADEIWEEGSTLQPDVDPLTAPLTERETEQDSDLSPEPPDIEVQNYNISLYGDGDDTTAATVIPLPQSTRPIFTSEIHNEKQTHSRYVEEFIPETLAGAAWGQGTPVFESLHLKQEEAGSRWDPFEDEEEWELAEWLAKNVGQKQMDMFLRCEL